MAILGVLMAVLALISWTIGDYSIEQSTRRVGDWETLFFIGLFYFVFVTPFIYRPLIQIFTDPITLYPLIFFSALTLFAALLLFQSLKVGKFSIIEPVFGVELPAAIFFAVFLGGEHLSPLIYALCFLVFLGLILAVTTHKPRVHLGRIILEKGVTLAVVGSILMGLIDYLTGHFSRDLSPLLANWFLNAFIGFFGFVYLVATGRIKNLFKDIKKDLRPFFGVGIFDNTGWVAYAYSMVYLPISVATTISESYIIFTILIGIFINKEKVEKHQIAGIIIAVIGILTLSYLFIR